MRKRLCTLVLLSAVLLLSFGVTKAKAAAGWEKHYTVYYSCIVGPTIPNDIQGEWDVDCDGNWTGWGWEPGHGCSSYQVTYGAYCGEP